MRINLDTDQCEANGVCVGIAPDVFELDDDDYLHIHGDEVADGDLPAVEEAVAQCPKAALRLS